MEEQSSALTGLGVGVAVALGAAVGGRLLVELVLGESQGQRLGRADPAGGLVVPEPAVTAAFLGAIWQVEGDPALGLQHTTQGHGFHHALFRLPRPVRNFRLS